MSFDLFHKPLQHLFCSIRKLARSSCASVVSRRLQALTRTEVTETQPSCTIQENPSDGFIFRLHRGTKWKLLKNVNPDGCVESKYRTWGRRERKEGEIVQSFDVFVGWGPLSLLSFCFSHTEGMWNHVVLSDRTAIQGEQTLKLRILLIKGKY